MCTQKGRAGNGVRPFFSVLARYTKHLRNHFCTIGLLAALSPQVFLAAEPQNAPTQVPTKQASAKQAAVKSTAVKAGAATAGASKPAVSSTRAAAKKAPPRPRYYAQLQPTPERYKEIQQALADNGYFSGTPDGVWAASSTDALKRFQHDQNLSEDGKVDALSLIALGLGPKRTANLVEPPK